jgi:putative phosphoesterase
VFVCKKVWFVVLYLYVLQKVDYMKLILISDSHGNKTGIDKIFNTLEFDYLFFMGDGLADIGNYSYLDNVYTVCGNCDFFFNEVVDREVEVGGLKIFMTHGHKYGVKLGLSKLVAKAKEVGAQIVFYGHTHIQKVEKIDNIYFINPGKFFKDATGRYRGLQVDLLNNGVNATEIYI